MNDTLGKWLASVAAALSVSAVGAMFFMWNQIVSMRAAQPLREQLRAVQLEQIRQGIQLNSQELGVMNMELQALRDRVRNLEARP